MLFTNANITINVLTLIPPAVDADAPPMNISVEHQIKVDELIRLNGNDEKPAVLPLNELNIECLMESIDDISFKTPFPVCDSSMKNIRVPTIFKNIVEEITIFIAAFVGALVGFLWYNTYPAQIFMGDTGSLTIGGIIAVIAVAVRKEWLIPLICGIFLIENLSVIIQVFYFKYTRRKYGTGKRIFKMSPLHHHYQMSGYHESKIVTRFWILGIFLAILSIITLKIR